MPLDSTAPALDLLLLNAAVQLELSARDRRVASRRYGLLQDHLNRPSSPLKPYLVDGRSLIHPQGSWSIGATIIHGADDDRFDLDGVVEFPVPPSWRVSTALDTLEEALQGFPDVQKIVRCTRCVQLQFAFMHLDVTPLDPASEPRDERVGEIFHHSKERREERRHAANPYGFAQWFRETVPPPARAFQEAVMRAREAVTQRDLISKGLPVLAEAAIEDLPDPHDPANDAPQVITLKLMKRYLNLRYPRRDQKRPPSVYLSKLAAREQTNAFGLCAQLEQFAGTLKHQMEVCVATGQAPNERNPRLWAESFNDRWPKDMQDVTVFLGDLHHLLSQLALASRSEFSEIQRIFSDLFGERVSSASAKAYLDGMSSGPGKTQFERGRGYVAGAAIGAAPAVAKAISPAPAHNFHPGILGRK